MTKPGSLSQIPFSRREFLGRTLAAASGLSLRASEALTAAAAQPPSCPIVVFSKVYQALNLKFEDAAEVTAEAGLDGIDPPVRPGGEVLPEKVADDLPRYFAAVGKHNLQMPLLTTAITSITSPHTELVVRTAKKLGVQFYRLGFIDRQKNVPMERQAREIKAQLNDLAALNKEVGIGALLQNHSPAGRTTYFGGDLRELELTVEGFDPAQVGIAFDIGHALVVHGNSWREHFDRLKSHFKIAYVKDVKLPERWVPFGQGDLAGSGYFKLLREIGYRAPISLHIEFDWTEQGKSKTRAGLIKALKESAAVLRQWLAA